MAASRSHEFAWCLAVVIALPSANAEFRPDTLWVAGAYGEILEITLERDAQGVPQSSEVSLFASHAGGWSPGLAFFEGELYYGAASEGTIYRYEADGTRIAYATGFAPASGGLASLLFDESGDLLACYINGWSPPPDGWISDIPYGGGGGPFGDFLGSPDVRMPIALVRDTQTHTVYVADNLASHGGDHDPNGKIIAVDASGAVSIVAEQLVAPCGLQIDATGNLYVSEHWADRVTKIDPATGTKSPLFAVPDHPEGIAADSFGFFYVALNNGDIVRFDANGNPEVLVNVGVDADQIVWFGGDGGGGNPGDIDGDGDVDLSDLAALLGAFGHCVGEPEYIPDADFDDNGCVDLSDLAVLLAHYGEGT